MRVPRAVLVFALFGVLLFGSGPLEAGMVISHGPFPVVLQQTNWMETIDVPQYDPANYGDLPLIEVSVHLELDIMGSVEATVGEGAGSATIELGQVGGTLGVEGPGGLMESIAASEDIAPPAIPFVEGEPFSDTFDTNEVGWFTFDSDDILAAHTGNSQVQYNLSASGSLLLQINGGNVSVSQTTQAGAKVTVDYKVIPESSSFILFNLGGMWLLIFAAIRRIML